MSHSENNSTDCISSISSTIKQYPKNRAISFRLKVKKNFRVDIHYYGGGVFMYVNQDVAARRIEYNSLSNNESICFELNLRKRKWLALSICKPPGYSEDASVKSLSSCITNATKEFENIVLPEDFIMTAENAKME